jgi:hypothetical protein
VREIKSKKKMREEIVLCHIEKEKKNITLSLIILEKKEVRLPYE